RGVPCYFVPARSGRLEGDGCLYEHVEFDAEGGIQWTNPHRPFWEWGSGRGRYRLRFTFAEVLIQFELWARGERSFHGLLVRTDDGLRMDLEEPDAAGGPERRRRTLVFLARDPHEEVPDLMT